LSGRDWDAFLESEAARVVEIALKEDLDGETDVTSDAVIAPDLGATAVLVAREEGVVCGLPAARLAFSAVDESVAFEPAVNEGSEVAGGLVLARVTGPARSLLLAERTALNLLQHLSGVATLTSKAVRLAKGTRARIFDTRKTTPGLRLLEKYAVAVGGGCNHRMGLFDGILLKDNHIALAGGVERAVEAARGANGGRFEVEVEVETLDELAEALRAGADVIMLDNMSVKMMRRAVGMVGGAAVVEASGGIGLDRVEEVAATGVDRISIGSLTSGARLDIALEIAS